MRVERIGRGNVRAPHACTRYYVTQVQRRSLIGAGGKHKKEQASRVWLLLPSLHERASEDHRLSHNTDANADISPPTGGEGSKYFEVLNTSVFGTLVGRRQFSRGGKLPSTITYVCTAAVPATLSRYQVLQKQGVRRCTSIRGWGCEHGVLEERERSRAFRTANKRSVCGFPRHSSRRRR